MTDVQTVLDVLAGVDLPPWVSAVGAKPMCDSDGEPAFAVYVVLGRDIDELDGEQLTDVRRSINHALRHMPELPYVRFVGMQDNIRYVEPSAEFVDRQAA